MSYQDTYVYTEIPSHPESSFNRPNGTVAFPNSAVGGNYDRQGRGSRRLKSILLRQRWLILAGLLSVLAGVTVLTRVWPRTYESTVTFIVDKPSSSADASPLATLERAGRTNDVETEIELIQSRRVLDTVVARLDLHVIAEDKVGEDRKRALFSGFDAGLDARPGIYRVVGDTTGDSVWDTTADTMIAAGPHGSQLRFSGMIFSLPNDRRRREIKLQVVAFVDAVTAAQGQIQAEPIHRDANLVRLACTGSTASFAQELCAAVAESYLRLRIELQHSAADATAHFLRGQVTQLGQQVAAAEDSAEAFGRRHRITNLDQQASEEVRQLATVKAQRDQLEAERAALAELIQGVEGSGGRASSHDIASFPTFVRNPGVTDLLQSLVQLENRRSDLAVRRTDKDPELSALSGRITAIENQLRSYAITYQQGLSAQVRSLDSVLENSGRRIAVIPGWQAQTARLARRVSLVQELHRLLETRLREAEIARSMSLPSVSIVDAASLASAPILPNVRLNLALGVMMGSLFGVALALYRERGNTRIYDREELELATSLPVVSILPVIHVRGPLARVSSAARVGTLDSSVFRGGLVVDTQRSRGHRKHRSRFRLGSGNEGALKQAAFEAFRSLGTDLHLSAAGVRSIMVTSAGPGEGKTFTACNLAVASVSRGARVLLIDADMRARGVSDFLRLSRSEPGLTDVLLGTATLREVEKLFHVNGAGELCVIPAGTVRHESGALLEKEEFTSLLAEARSAFDLVILDTPPLNIIADAATIAARVDATLLVVRSGVTDKEALRLTLERLERTHGPVAGVVLNGVDLPSQYASYSYQRV